MGNLLIALYESGEITDEEVKEFNEWHKEICYCDVCGVKLMHDDEAYGDEKFGGALCDAHSIMNEETNNYTGPTSDELREERHGIIRQMNVLKEHGKIESDAFDKLDKELQHMNIYFNKILKYEFANKC